MSRDRSEIVEALKRKTEEDIENARFYCWFYDREVKNSQKVGKQKAMEDLVLYQSHLKHQEQHLELLQNYAAWLHSGNTGGETEANF